jgi:hypothetical protein
MVENLMNLIELQTSILYNENELDKSEEVNKQHYIAKIESIDKFSLIKGVERLYCRSIVI